MLIVYSATVLVSALLLFLVEPMFARMALPLLGGAPSVWNTALVWYQAALLAGYAYAHVTSSRLDARRQAMVHLGLVLLAFLTLPIALPRGWQPPTHASPIPWLLLVLTVSLGLPFFVLSATAPLVQRWLASTRHDAASDPYFLYAASNLGSMVGLLSYPIGIETRFGLRDQTRYWAMGFGLLAILTVSCALLLARRSGAPTPSSAPAGAKANDAAPNAPTADQLARGENRSPLRRRLRWLLLAFVPSSLMQGVTTHLTTDIVSMPLLWILPLAVYLLSFILVFAPRTLVPHRLMVRALPFCILPLTVVMIARAVEPLNLVITLHLLVLFIVSMICHGELALDRPPASELTGFYLWLALGGVLGGIFNVFVAPFLFKTVLEYPIALILACWVMPARRGAPSSTLARAFDLIVPAVVVAVMVVFARYLGRGDPFHAHIVAVGFGALLVIPLFAFRRRPLRFALAVGAMLLANPVDLLEARRVLDRERSFFGVHRVAIDVGGPFHDLYHGTTLHGMQRYDPAPLRKPIGYYGQSGPLGDVFRALPARPGRRVGVIGLGSGGITAYAGEGESWTYYEIDPVVERIARDPRLFAYLSTCPARLRVVIGDGRRSLEADTSARYDLLILDAYSSDAIPVHLLTRESLGLYLSRLAPGGALVFHISNRYFALAPVLSRLANDRGLICLVRSTGPLTGSEIREGYSSSVWAMVATRAGDLGDVALDRRWHAPRPWSRVRLWTDDYSSPMTVFTR